MAGMRYRKGWKAMAKMNLGALALFSVGFPGVRSGNCRDRCHWWKEDWAA